MTVQRKSYDVVVVGAGEKLHPLQKDLTQALLLTHLSRLVRPRRCQGLQADKSRGKNGCP